MVVAARVGDQVAAAISYLDSFVLIIFNIFGTIKPF
jgi:hypothetical protein